MGSIVSGLVEDLIDYMSMSGNSVMVDCTWVLRQAVEVSGLPDNLKLSVHSGSDKFAIYPETGRLLKK